MRFDFMGYNNTPYIVGEEDLKTEEIVLEKEVKDGIYFVKKQTLMVSLHMDLDKTKKTIWAILLDMFGQAELVL